MNAHGPVGLFGKIPAQGDFLRANVFEAGAMPLVHWLEDGNELLHRCGAKLDREPLAFVFRSPEGNHALLGVLGPGADAVGRTFPFAVFVPVSARDLSEVFPLVPAIYRPFLDGACDLLSELVNLMPKRIIDQLARLQLPGAANLAEAEALARDTGAESARDLQQRIFGQAPAGQQYYAYRTFQVACQRAREGEGARVNIALDCPCARASDVWAWLELSRRLLRRVAPPSFVWRYSSATAALVLSLGTLPPAIFPFLATTSHASQNIWPLRTQQVSAITAASKALSPAQLAVIDRPDATVGELVFSLSQP